jgi:deoxyribodipyrimidine photolyase-related protein
MEATLIFPHQLFEHHPALDQKRKVILVEEWLYFRQFSFHQHKLVLHRASMRAFADRLLQQGYEVMYIDGLMKEQDCRKLIPYLQQQGVKHLYWVDTEDNWLEKRIRSSVAHAEMQTTILRSPNFITTQEEFTAFFSARRRYFQTDFYVWQRKRFKILVNQQEEPQGGQWSYDADNREKFNGQIPIPRLPTAEADDHIAEAIAYVQKQYPNNPGDASTFAYPVTYASAKAWLQDFLTHRFKYFGPYEDAMVPAENILFHSVLTPMLNIGLLDPREIINAAIKYAKENNIPINSLEGFIRQVIGWREFIRAIYQLEGGKQRTRNYFGYHRKIPASFWDATTGIVPVDTVIRHILKDGYTHHINRLMVLGNFMLLCEFDPDEVYQWFMEMFVDAYDWVMVPNVYGMTQYADGGLMATKPYISGSNYLMKMGSWPKGPWQGTWDALFWRYVHVNRETLGGNHRLGMMVRTFDKFSKEKQDKLLAAAEDFLSGLN